MKLFVEMNNEEYEKYKNFCNNPDKYMLKEELKTYSLENFLKAKEFVVITDEIKNITMGERLRIVIFADKYNSLKVTVKMEELK